MNLKPLPLSPLLLLFFLILAPPVGAVEEITQQHIQYFDIPSPDGLCISGMELYDISPNSNNTFVFNQYGKIYTLNINSTKSWGWWTFDLTLQNPNGSIETKQIETLAPAALDWDFYVQYYFLSSDTVFDLDVYASLLPLSATFQTNNPTLSNITKFSNIQGSSDSYYNLKLYLSTEEEFQQQTNNELLPVLSEAASDVFDWTWSAILTFIEKIPLVGGHLSALLVLTTMTLSSIIFYTKLFFIDYSETTFLTIEFFILSYSFTKRGTFWTKLKRVMDSHIRLIEIIINTAQAAVNLFGTIIQTITSIINSLKPI